LKSLQEIKKEIADLRGKLGTAEASGLSWEATRILQLFAQGLSDYQDPSCRTPWRQNYAEALKAYAEELRRPEGPSTRTLWWLLFMTSYRGGEGSEKAKKSQFEFCILARRIAPKATEELLSGTEENKRFLEYIDKLLAKLTAAGELA
jgi:hypothetical protein